MKIFKIAMICSIMLTLVSVTAFASTSAQTAAGAPMTIASGTIAASPDFSFTPSPSTLMDAVTGENTFALTGSSSKTTTENGVVYGVLSSESAIFQDAQTTDGTNIAPTDDETLPAGFEDKAGNSPAGS